MKELGKDAFPDLAAAYAREGKTVIGYTHWDDGPNYGLPKLEVKWVWSELTNSHDSHDDNHA